MLHPWHRKPKSWCGYRIAIIITVIIGITITTTGSNPASKNLCPNVKSLFSKPRNAVADGASHASDSMVISGNGEKSAREELPFCKLGNQIDSGFARVCYTVAEHAGESNMDDHFRTALSAAMEELLWHRRECTVCGKGAPKAKSVYL